MVGKYNIVTTEEVKELESLSVGIIQNYLEQLDITNKQTLANYKQGAQMFFKYLNEEQIESVSRQTIKDYKKWLKCHYDQNKLRMVKYKATSMNTYMAELKTFFNYLETLGVPNYAKDLKRERVNTSRHLRDNLTLEQVKTIFSSIDTTTEQGARENAIFRLMVGTGIRECEVVAAKIEDIRPHGSKIVLEVQGKGYQSIENNKSDLVELTPSVLKAINYYLSFRQGAKPSEPLFCSVNNSNMGKSLTTRTLRNIVKGLYVRNGIISDRITTHSLRHTAITLALSNGASLIKAKEMARHTNINTTMIYAHDLNRFVDNAEGVLETALNS